MELVCMSKGRLYSFEALREAAAVGRVALGFDRYPVHKGWRRDSVRVFHVLFFYVLLFYQFLLLNRLSGILVLMKSFEVGGYRNLKVVGYYVDEVWKWFVDFVRLWWPSLATLE